MNDGVVLARKTRVFVKREATSMQLVFAEDCYMPRGARVILGAPVSLMYDHRTLVAMPLLCLLEEDKGEWYVLKEELVTLERIQ